MKGGTSDASTSTDDIKGRPLCLFYFTHPFGVLSPEPPTVTAAPPHIARAFLNMEPIEPFHFWTASSTDDSYNTATSDTSRPSYDLGNATVHKNPVNLVSVKKTRKCTVDFGSRRQSISSSLFSSDIWFNSSASSKSNDYTRRMVPYNRILPPLQLPRNISDLDSSDDMWPKKCLNPGKFSLPPIDMPTMKVELVTSTTGRKVEEVSGMESVREVRMRRRVGAGVGAGVRKHRRRRLGDVRRMLTCLMRRAVKGGRSESNPSPALQDVLHIIREAWTEPTSLFDRTWRTLTRMCDTATRSRDVSPRGRCGVARGEAEGERTRQAMLGEPPVRPLRPDASPGLLRRRYSVPETVMRKYSMAQQRAECEESGEVSRGSAASLSPVRGTCSPCATPRFARDRELMRKSALLRRMWGRTPPSCCCCEDSAPRQARSLDASRSELRPRRAARSPPDACDEPTPVSASTYRSHAWVASSCAETTVDVLTDPEAWRSDGHTTSLLVDSTSTAVTAELESQQPQSPPTNVVIASHGLEDISPAFSLSESVATDTSASGEPELCTQVSCDARHDRRFGGCSVAPKKDTDNVPCVRPLTVEMPSTYEVLEIVVSETLDTSVVPVVNLPRTFIDESLLRASDRTSRVSPINIRSPSKVNIDEYVSNILVESLNSLTDRLECMTASIGSDKRINIVEKEIKVKLQNTGVNTIVHLSPTSNNQIIFGNEELCDSGDRDVCNNPRDSISIREEPHSVESNNNIVSAGSTDRPCATEAFGNVIQQDNVNKAVLQQIQKLFQDELHSLDADMNYTGNVMPGISHIEISNVDVYIDDNTDPNFGSTNVIEVHTGGNRNTNNGEVMGGIGTGNYFDDGKDVAIVPRLSAFPHTDSMEVNTSSSDDAENLGSDCTSLVDSLDDPNSPRSILLRRSFNSRRNELVRSAINVLDLLPENARDDENAHLKDKGETFFIGIKDEDCDCDRENVNVADRMPEKIKQRLFRRHRRRQLRMECARRSRVKELRREKEKQWHDDMCKSKREIEKDCMAIINALIDDVIAKIVQDEYKCLRIKRKPDKPVVTSQKSEENMFKRNRKKDLRQSEEVNEIMITKHNTGQRRTKGEDQEHEAYERQIRGKLSLLARPAVPINDRGPRRVYQKSEILEGNKCIEILEIIEYVNDPRSSPETPVSDESPSPTARSGKRSRIPVPVHEKIQRPMDVRNSTNEPQVLPVFYDKKLHSREFNASTPPEIEHRRRASDGDARECTISPSARRASLPPTTESRPRSNSLRFRRVFDIIPEERSSLRVDSSADDVDRTPVPVISTPEAHRRNDRINPHPPPTATRNTRTVATSPLGEVNATSGPLRVKGGEAKRGRVWPTLARREEGIRDKTEPIPPTRRVGRRIRNDKVDIEKGGKFPTVERKPEIKPEFERKVNRAKPVSGERGKIKLRPPNRYLVDQGPGLKSDDRRVGARAPEPSEEGPSCSTLSPAEDGGSSSSGESGGSLLCSLAPKWLSTRARQRRHRRSDADASTYRQQHEPDESGGWSVTVAGSCRAALPADIEMRLRFPRCDRDPRCHDDTCACNCAAGNCQWADCSCSTRVERGCRPARPLPPAPLAAPPLAVPGHASHRLAASDSKLTLTMKKEARDSSLLASKSMRKSCDPLPDLETYRSTRSKTKSSVKTRRGYSLHCWLPEDERALIRPNNGLSVLGSAIIPELKPRVPTMSERDLTRLYTPRHYLRS